MEIPKRIKTYKGWIKIEWEGDRVYVVDSDGNRLPCNAGITVSGSPPTGQLHAFGYGLPGYAAKYLADAIANAQRDAGGKWWDEFLECLANEMVRRCIPKAENRDEAEEILNRWEKEDAEKPTTH